MILGFCEEINCHQQKVFCLDCEGQQNMHLFHIHSIIQYKEIKQIVESVDLFKFVVVQASTLLSYWKQILQQFSSRRQKNIKICMFVYKEGIYFFESSYQFHYTNTQKVIQAIYRSRILGTTSLKLEFIQFMQESSQSYQLFYKFPQKFHIKSIKMKQFYFTLSYDQYDFLSRLKKFDSLSQLLNSNLQSDVMIGTKTCKWINKGYLSALYASKSSTGIAIKMTLKGIHCLVFTLD